jgi:hypothetical protein
MVYFYGAAGGKSNVGRWRENLPRREDVIFIFPLVETPMASANI